MATTLENILGGGNKPVSPHTPPGFAPDMQGAAATPQQGGQTQNNATTQKPQTDTTAQDKSTKRDGIKAASISALIPKEELHVPDGAIPKQPQQPKRLSYEEMFRQLYPYKPPTQEELEKERKKQRREQIFAAIGDGISALSNLYFTTQYAPNMYSGRNTASQRVKDRWDKLAADRNANMTAYINGLMRARQADDAYNRSEREWERQLGIDKIKQQRDAAADKRAEAKEQRDQEMHDLNKQLRNNQITQAEHEAKKAEVEARYAPQLEESKIGRNRAAAGASNASASASRARARYYDNGGSSGNRYYGEFQGKTYKTQADYEKAVLDAARDAGVDIYDTEVTERNFKGEPRKQRRVKRSIAAIAAEVDEKTNQFNVEDYKRGGGTGSENSAPPLN